jgi:hypothetical protein
VNTSAQVTSIFLKLTAVYIYLGDRQTASTLKGKPCNAVRRADRKCIRGKNGSMLVAFENVEAIVVARLLRKIKGPPLEDF